MIQVYMAHLSGPGYGLQQTTLILSVCHVDLDLPQEDRLICKFSMMWLLICTDCLMQIVIIPTNLTVSLIILLHIDNLFSSLL